MSYKNVDIPCVYSSMTVHAELFKPNVANRTRVQKAPIIVEATLNGDLA